MDTEISGKPPIVTTGMKRADAWGINFTFLLTGVSEQNDLSALYRAAVSGVALNALLNFSQSVGRLSNGSTLVKLVGLSGRTIRRRLKNPHERLSAEQSARAIRGALLLDQAVRAIGSPELAEEWMLTPSIGLDGGRPIDFLENSIGAQLVGDYLTRLEYGVYQ